VKKSLLKVDDVYLNYGKSSIVFGASLEVEKNKVISLLGRNGAGKSTLLKAVIGLVPVKSGSIIFDGHDITNEPPYKRSKIGIGYIPEGRRLFPKLTVKENLRVAAYATRDIDGIEMALELFPALRRYLKHKAGSLSGGEQQMLAIARGLIGKKKLLLLDEPLQGLAPSIVSDLLRSIVEIKKKCGILLVEQNVPKALEVSDKVYIMHEGKVVWSGEPSEDKKNKDVMDLLILK